MLGGGGGGLAVLVVVDLGEELLAPRPHRVHPARARGGGPAGDGPNRGLRLQSRLVDPHARVVARGQVAAHGHAVQLVGVGGPGAAGAHGPAVGGVGVGPLGPAAEGADGDAEGDEEDDEEEAEEEVHPVGDEPGVVGDGLDAGLADVGAGGVARDGGEVGAVDGGLGVEAHLEAVVDDGVEDAAGRLVVVVQDLQVLAEGPLWKAKSRSVSRFASKKERKDIFLTGSDPLPLLVVVHVEAGGEEVLLQRDPRLVELVHEDLVDPLQLEVVLGREELGVLGVARVHRLQHRLLLLDQLVAGVLGGAGGLLVPDVPRVLAGKVLGLGVVPGVEVAIRAN